MSSQDPSRPNDSLFVEQDSNMGDTIQGLDPNMPIPSLEDLEMFGNETEPMENEIRRYILSDTYLESSETLSQTTGNDNVIDHALANVGGTSAYAEATQGQDNTTDMAIDPALTGIGSSHTDLPMRDAQPADNALAIDPALANATVQQPGTHDQASYNEETANISSLATSTAPQTVGQPAGESTVQTSNRQPSPEWTAAVERENSLSPTLFGPVRPRRGASRQGASTRGGRRGRGGRGRGRVNTADAVADPSPYLRYAPLDHNPPDENRAGRTRDRSREGRAPPPYVPGDPENPPPNPMGDVRPNDSEPRAMIWVDAARFDLLLQVAYERRHETLSEKAWRRIATGCHGGPFRDASWNAVRLEFSRLMRDRFPGYGQDSPLADRRRRYLDMIAYEQSRGQPTQVSPADLDHNVTDASTDCPRPRSGISRASTRSGTSHLGSSQTESSSHAEARHAAADTPGETSNADTSHVEAGQGEAGQGEPNNGETNNETDGESTERASNGLPYTYQFFH